MLPAGFEPAIPAGERPQTHALDHATTGIGSVYFRALNLKMRKITYIVIDVVVVVVVVIIVITVKTECC
jgi:uncharacterized membrane protein